MEAMVTQSREVPHASFAGVLIAVLEFEDASAEHCAVTSSEFRCVLLTTAFPFSVSQFAAVWLVVTASAHFCVSLIAGKTFFS